MIDQDIFALVDTVQSELLEESSVKERQKLSRQVAMARAALSPNTTDEIGGMSAWAMLACCEGELLLRNDRPKDVIRLLKDLTECDGLLYKEKGAQILRARAENESGKSNDVITRLAPLFHCGCFKGDPDVASVVGTAYANTGNYLMARQCLEAHVQLDGALRWETSAQHSYSLSLIMTYAFQHHQDHFSDLLAKDALFEKDWYLQNHAAQIEIARKTPLLAVARLEPFVGNRKARFYKNPVIQITYGKALNAARLLDKASDHFLRLWSGEGPLCDNRDVANIAAESLLGAKRYQEAIDLLDPWIEIQEMKENRLRPCCLYAFACSKLAIDQRTGLSPSQMKARLISVLDSLDCMEQQFPEASHHVGHRQVKKFVRSLTRQVCAPFAA